MDEPDLTPFWRLGKDNYTHYSAADKESLSLYMVAHGHKFSWAEERYPGLIKQTVNSWLKKAASDLPKFYAAKGKPTLLSETVKGQITGLAEGGMYTKKELVVKAHKLVVADAVDQNMVDDEDKRHLVGDRTLTNFIDNIDDVVERPTEYITDARERETV